jgi:hypothetical protein
MELCSQSVSQWASQPASQSVSQSASEPASQPVSQSASQPIRQSVSQSLGCSCVKSTMIPTLTPFYYLLPHFKVPWIIRNPLSRNLVLWKIFKPITISDMRKRLKQKRICSYIGCPHMNKTFNTVFETITKEYRNRIQYLWVSMIILNPWRRELLPLINTRRDTKCSIKHQSLNSNWKLTQKYLNAVKSDYNGVLANRVFRFRHISA